MLQDVKNSGQLTMMTACDTVTIAAEIAATMAAVIAAHHAVVGRNSVISYAVPAVRMTIVMMSMIRVGAILFWDPSSG